MGLTWVVFYFEHCEHIAIDSAASNISTKRWTNCYVGLLACKFSTCILMAPFFNQSISRYAHLTGLVADTKQCMVNRQLCFGVYEGSSYQIITINFIKYIYIYIHLCTTTLLDKLFSMCFSLKKLQYAYTVCSQRICYSTVRPWNRRS